MPLDFCMKHGRPRKGELGPCEPCEIMRLEAALVDIINKAEPVLTGGPQTRALSEIWHLARRALGDKL